MGEKVNQDSGAGKEVGIRRVVLVPVTSRLAPPLRFGTFQGS